MPQFIDPVRLSSNEAPERTHEPPWEGEIEQIFAGRLGAGGNRNKRDQGGVGVNTGRDS